MKLGYFVSAFFLFLAASCTDHITPEQELTIKTLPFERVSQTTIFKIDAKKLGGKPVVEYGIVYTAYFRGVGGHVLLPTIDNNRIVFSTAIALGINQFTYTPDFFGGRTFFYYRAYAILDDGSIVYGNQISFQLG